MMLRRPDRASGDHLTPQEFLLAVGTITKAKPIFLSLRLTGMLGLVCIVKTLTVNMRIKRKKLLGEKYKTGRRQEGQKRKRRHLL